MKTLLKYSIVTLLLCSVLMVNGDEFSGKKEKVISYYPNGVIKEKGTLKDGQKHNIWWSYYESGVRKTKEKYKKGIRIYLFEYDEKGLMVKITNKEGIEREVEDCGC